MTAKSGEKNHFEKLLDDAAYMEMDLWTASSLNHKDIIKQLLRLGFFALFFFMTIF